jgi:predicted flap endonuclease-1-like 5' DNA nuclease
VLWLIEQSLAGLVLAYLTGLGTAWLLSGPRRRRHPGPVPATEAVEPAAATAAAASASSTAGAFAAARWDDTDPGSVRVDQPYAWPAPGRTPLGDHDGGLAVATAVVRPARSGRRAAHTQDAPRPVRDDLMRIPGIDTRVADALLEAGYRTYAHLSRARADDLRRVLRVAGLVPPATLDRWADTAAAFSTGELR